MLEDPNLVSTIIKYEQFSLGMGEQTISRPWKDGRNKLQRQDQEVDRQDARDMDSGDVTKQVQEIIPW